MADVDITTLGAQIKTAYASQVAQVSGVEITAGTETSLRTYSPKDVADIVAAHGVGTKLGTATVAGAAATTLPLSSLDLSAYTAFKILINLKNATGSDAAISMYYNADTTATNYYNNVLSVNAAAVNAARANSALITNLRASSNTTGIVKIISDIDGFPRAQSNAVCDVATAVESLQYWHIWTTAANVTTITLSSSVASSLAIGSTFTVYGIT